MTEDMIGGDFLGDNATATGAANAVMAVRRELTEWAAGTLLNRHPTVASYRGKKGLLACRQDLDFHLIHLQSSLAADDAMAMVTYARWVEAVLAQRGVTRTMLGHGIVVLAEGLRRFVPPVEAEFAVHSLRSAFADNE